MKKNSESNEHGQGMVFLVEIVVILFATLGLLLWPRESASSVEQGLQLCGKVIIPALFPFFVLSSLVIDLGFSSFLGKRFSGIMKPLFRLNGNCASALILGFVGGYPVGAKTAITLYESGQCSETEARRLLAFSNNCGVGFIIGVVGVGLCTSSKIGWILYLCHILACITVGILFRFYGDDGDMSETVGNISVETSSFVPAFLRSVRSAVESTLHICGFILCFSVVIQLLKRSSLLSFGGALVDFILYPLGLPSGFGESFLVGSLELSSGVSSLIFWDNFPQRLGVLAFFLAWGGLSVHCQVLAFAESSGLPLHTYFIGKLLHGVFAGFYSYCFARLLKLEAISPNLEPTFAVGEFTGQNVLSCGVSWLFLLGILLFFLFSRKIQQ